MRLILVRDWQQQRPLWQRVSKFTMRISRRRFLAVGLAGAGGLYARNCLVAADAAMTRLRLADEDGYKLWLRYAPAGDTARRYRRTIRQIRVEGTSATAGIIRNELGRALTELLGSTIRENESGGLEAGTVVIGTPDSSPRVRDLKWAADLNGVGDEGFIIRSTLVAKRSVTVIAANSDIGALYGSFHFLRLLQTGRRIDRLDIIEQPMVQLRLMNHWDNLDGTVERGYGGRSLWQWNELPESSAHGTPITRAPARPSASTAR